MTKRCYLHIGMMKAGSSAIQSFFFENHDRLRHAHDIDYWGGARNHSDLATALKPDDHLIYRARGLVLESQREEFRNRLLGPFERDLKASRCSRFVISGEGFCTTGMDEIRALKKMLDPHFDQITVVCYMRDPYSFARSQCQQMFKFGHTYEKILRDTFEGPEVDAAKKLERTTLAPQYRGYTRRYFKVFGRENVLLRDFSRDKLRDGDVVSDFVHLITGKDISELSDTKSVPDLNASMDHHIAWLLERVNRRLPRFINNDTRQGLNFERPGRAQQYFIKQERHASFELTGFDFDRFHDIVQPEVKWLATETDGRIDFRGPPPKEKAVEPIDASDAVAGMIENLIERLNTKTIEARLYRAQYMLTQGKFVKPQIIKAILPSCKEPDIMLKHARDLGNLGAPDLALLVAKRGLDLCKSGAKPDKTKPLTRLIKELELGHRNGKSANRDKIAWIRGLGRTRVGKFFVGHYKSFRTGWLHSPKSLRNSIKRPNQ